MAYYGITNSSQLIDLETIKTNCNNFKQALNDFEVCGKKIKDAGNMLTPEALSINEDTFEYPLPVLGEAISNLKQEYSAYVDFVVAQATIIYNQQATELNEFLASQKQQEPAKTK